jgi:SAM-dependent methyltransferase
MQTSDAERSWEDRYQAASPRSSGEPGKVVRHFAEPLVAGRALELGCGKADDAVWLAKSGWTVIAVDISSTALGYAAANAERAGVKDLISFQRHDLSQSFPEGQFDLVTASFLAASPREPVFRRAAEVVAPGGHLLIVDHASRLPWSSAPPDKQYPTAEETLAALDLEERHWTRLRVDTIERLATGPNDQTAMVRDSVVFLRRIGAMNTR